MYALLETGLTVKEGTQRLAEQGGPYEITPRSVWVDNTGSVHAAYLTNQEKFLAAFLLATFPDDEAYNNSRATTLAGRQPKS